VATLLGNVVLDDARKVERAGDGGDLAWVPDKVVAVNNIHFFGERSCQVYHLQQS
jgi:hypothetical protein